MHSNYREELQEISEKEQDTCSYLFSLNHCSWKSIKEKSICTFRFTKVVIYQFNHKSITNKLKMWGGKNHK